MDHSRPISGFVVEDLQKVTGTIAVLEDLIGENRLPCDGINASKLAMLHRLLFGGPIDDMFAAAYMHDSQLPLDTPRSRIYTVPGNLQAALLLLSDAEVEAFGRRWCVTDEFQLEQWKSEEVVGSLQSLVTMVRKAFEQNQSLFLWVADSTAVARLGPTKTNADHRQLHGQRTFDRQV